MTTRRPRRDDRWYDALLSPAGAAAVILGVATGVAFALASPGSSGGSGEDDLAAVAPETGTGSAGGADGPAPPSSDPGAAVPALDPTGLPRPSLDVVLPGGLPVAGRATGFRAVPVGETVVGFTAPGGDPVLAVGADELGMAAGWAVTDQSDDWVQVMVPFGRGALASVDPARTNHLAMWVRAVDVVVEPARTYTLDLSERSVTAPGWSAPVGVGKESTPTPTGLCAIVGQVQDPHVGAALLTSCQSEVMDEYVAGTGYAVVALHTDPERGRAVGQARSNGCIRLRGEDFQALLESARPGDLLVVTE